MTLASSRSRSTATKKAATVVPKTQARAKVNAKVKPEVKVRPSARPAIPSVLRKVSDPKKVAVKATLSVKPAKAAAKTKSPIRVPKVQPSAIGHRVKLRTPRPFPEPIFDPVGLVGLDMGPLPNDEVFDEADGAQHLQLREIAETQRRARLLNQPERHPDFDGKHCVDCDAVIPKVRLALQRVRCVECQQEVENANKRQEIARR